MLRPGMQLTLLSAYKRASTLTSTNHSPDHKRQDLTNKSSRPRNDVFCIFMTILAGKILSISNPQSLTVRDHLALFTLHFNTIDWYTRLTIAHGKLSADLRSQVLAAQMASSSYCIQSLVSISRWTMRTSPLPPGTQIRFSNSHFPPYLRSSIAHHAS